MTTTTPELNIVGDYSKDPVVVVLSGLPGCGKSHFCLDLLEDSDDEASKWVVVSQDSLGNRKRCEQVVHDALSQGKLIVQHAISPQSHFHKCVQVSE